MASIVTYADGLRRIEFSLTPNGPRRVVRLGRANAKQAEGFNAKLETIIADKLQHRTHDAEVSKWLGELDCRLYAKLVKAGLATPRDGDADKLTCIGLGQFIAEYISSRVDVKASTRTTYGKIEKNLVEFFGASEPLLAITPGRADKFRLFLVGKKLAENTVRRRCGKAKQIFRAAVRERIIDENPFADIVTTTRGNSKRDFFITRDDAQKVIDACPNAEWKLLFALCRFGGLRCPSEHLRLRWVDVDWERGRMTVHSPKTEHHEGGASRKIPIFPELLPCLRDCFEQAEAGAEYIITRYRDTTQNLRTQLNRIIAKSGLKPWPKLWHNLRATRETELCERWPLHVVCDWIGNSARVAAEHYLQVTEDHFRRAAGSEPEAQQKAQQTAAGDDGQGMTTAKPECEIPLQTEGQVASGQLCTTAVEAGGWAIQGSNL